MTHGLTCPQSQSAVVKIRHSRIQEEIVSFCYYFTVENMNRELSCTRSFHKTMWGYGIHLVDGQVKNVHQEITLHCREMLRMLNFYMGFKSGWTNKERKFCKELIAMRIAALVGKVPHL